MAAVLVSATVMGSGQAVAETNEGCPILDQLGDRVEGEVSPSACAFITKQTEFGAMRSDTPEAREARVRLYGTVFAADGTLAESGSAAPVRGRAGIENNLRTLLGAFPTFRFTPVKIVVNGDAVFYEAANEAVINGQMVRYPAVYRVVLENGEVTEGRRYHDRTEWFRPIEKEALRQLFAGVADNCPRQGPAFTGPGLTAPVTDPKCHLAYLGRLSGAMTGVRLTADQAAAGPRTKFQEYRGTVRAKGRTIDFGVIVGTEPGMVRYYFDTLPLNYDDAEMGALFTKLLTGSAPPAR
ncbi:nuclear transport factor 2 family protein [Amycolatopsis sp. WAC 01376]|uniref:nuclear transport factor 2 family protein n=1 Tax=Amycolatopsis sp. WAC 01376 TaxID=2203195 RepID=UPI001F28D9DA|nr:nuclear transport factor 2 family protein [Amycolatopsis sp. WAC 01376]